MRSVRNLVGNFTLITLINLIVMVNSGSCQVNENELGTFFKNRLYRKHSSDFFKVAKAYLDSELRKYPKGSASYEQFFLMRKLLLKKDPLMTAPPFLDVNNCEKGDIGMMSANNRFIPYVKYFQILDDKRALMKCSFDINADDDDWSGPFLWVAEQGSVWSTGQIKEGKIGVLGIIAFKKIDDYVYRNQLGGLRKVPAVEVLPSDVWASLVRKYKTTPGSKKSKRPSPSKSKPAGTKKMAAEAAKGEYWLKRGELIRGPFKSEAILQFAKNEKLKPGDELGSSKEGPWQNITKENLKKIKQGSSQPLKSAFLDKGLVAYYPFNGNAKDESGNGNDCIKVNANQSTDRFGTGNRAFVFKGNEFIVFPKLNVETTTLTAWAAVADVNRVSSIVSIPRKPNGSGVNVGTHEGKIRPFLDGQGGEPNAKVVAGKWHFFCATQSDDNLSLYLDGKIVRVIRQTWKTNRDFGQIGREVYQDIRDGTGVRSFVGSIDDVRIYNRVLSTTEVKQLYEYESKPPADNQ